MTLKGLFTSAPVLILPQPSRQFIMEVDASDVGIGTVLSQRLEEDQHVHPVAFLSHRFSPAEMNYDVGNQELLAVHAALSEWRHWLEGAQQPIVVRAQEPYLHQGRQEVGTQTGALGTVLQPVQLLPDLPPGLQECEGRRSLPSLSVRDLQQQSNPEYHPPSGPGGGFHHLGN